MKNNTYLNGEFMDIHQAKIPVMDRGFLFGDSVYEVIPIFQQATFGMTEHLDRLDCSLLAIGIPPPLTALNWSAIFSQLLDQNDIERGALYIQVTRGCDETRAHLPSGIAQPTIFATIIPTQDPAGRTINAVTVTDQRWLGCRIKATTLLPNVLAKLKAEEHHATDAILVQNGHALEGTSSNVFAVINNAVVTPPLDQNILPGITRQFLLNVMHQAHIPCIERPISTDELSQAEEIWLTSSTQDLIPVTMLNDSPVGSGEPGPMWRRANKAFQTYKQQAIASSHSLIEPETLYDP